jgi:hypothetical protein
MIIEFNRQALSCSLTNIFKSPGRFASQDALVNDIYWVQAQSAKVVAPGSIKLRFDRGFSEVL